MIFNPLLRIAKQIDVLEFMFTNNIRNCPIAEWTAFLISIS
jgi:hypothetical protein